MGLFQGHQVLSLVQDLLLAIIIPSIIFFLSRMGYMPKIGRGMKFWDYFWAFTYAMLIPNSTYAFFELRHLIFIDQVADVLTPTSFLVFGGLSLIGLLTTIWGIRLVVDYYAKSRAERSYYALALSAACGFGAVMGVMQFYSLPAVFFPPILILGAIELLSRPHLVAVALLTSIVLYLLNLFLDHFQKPA